MSDLDLASFLVRCPVASYDTGELTQYLYALLDVDDEVIYVGRTEHLAERIRTHRRTKPWWPEVVDIASVRVCHLGRVTASELNVIRRLAPKHNVDPRDSAHRGHQTRARRFAEARSRGLSVRY